MKKSKKRQSLEKRLKAYSAAATGALLLAPSAHAAVQYSGVQNIIVDSDNALVFLDLDGNATNDFSFGYTTNSFNIRHRIVGLDPSNQVINSFTGLGAPSLMSGPSRIPIYYFFNANLPSNYNIQSTLTAPYNWVSYGIPDISFLQPPAVGAPSLNGYLPGPAGNFNGTSGFIGVRFNTDCGNAFGWIQYQANVTSTQGTIIDWAYEDACVPILAGDTGAPAVSVPTLNQWGLFALIALLAGAGVTVLRKQEESY